MVLTLSVVGSGPILCPGKSCFNKLRIKDVFPTEYWPRMSTIGLASKSLAASGGEPKLANFDDISNGNTFLLYNCFRPSKITSLSTWVSSSFTKRPSPELPLA